MVSETIFPAFKKAGYGTRWTFFTEPEAPEAPYLIEGTITPNSFGVTWRPRATGGAAFTGFLVAPAPATRWSSF